MNKFTTPLEMHYEKFNNKNGNLLPAFIIWDSVKEDYKKINPDKYQSKIQPPEYFGDNMSDELNDDDKFILKNYFLKFYQLKKKFGFIVFRVGKKDFNIKLSSKKEGIEFSSPRNSLIFSIKNNIFDDLLIGNFMKTRLINVPSLYPDFTPYVTKYGDNGISYSKDDLKKYFNYYRLNSANFWIDFLKLKSEDKIRTSLEKYRKIYYFARNLKRKIL